MASILTFVAEEILSELLSLAAEEAKLVSGFKGELKSLQKRMKLVVAFLLDAGNKSADLGSSVDIWLKNLKAAVYEAEAIIDGFRYEALRQKIEVQGRFKNKVTDFFSLSKNPLAFRLKLAHQIKNINSVLDGVNKEASDLGLQAALVSAPKHSESGSVHYGAWGGDLTKIVGREHDASYIVEKLLSSDNEERLPVISIIGMAGQGKTTLANLVCQTESVVRYFDHIIRVSVSDDFEVNRTLNHIAEFFFPTNPRMSNNHALVEHLKGVLKDKKYLLTLDDVWNEDRIKWNSLKGALVEIGASMASKIFVTTRSKTVALVMQSSLVYELEGLSMDDSWTVFKQRAFATGGALETEPFVQIGKEIVGRCGGLPLAIDVLGSLMHSMKLETDWLSVRSNNMWGSIEDVSNLVINVIKLSFDHLSPSLKQCFAYSSIFPKDSDIRKDSLVQFWMALGLLPYRKDSYDQLEVVGDMYFDALLRKSLLQEATTDDFGNIEHCKMHDLVHDLAERESKGNCLTLRDSSERHEIPDEIIHLSLSSPTRETIARVCSLSLQTLILEGSLLGDTLQNFKFLRVLVLVDRDMIELPKSVRKMKHLRYLDIVETGIKELPSFLTKLYNLQTLKVGRRWMQFPKKFVNLVNLRHLYGGGKVVGVGKLTSLQTLSLFEVNREEGCLIGELGGLVNLKGTIVIEGLEDVASVEEAQSARLFEKSKLQYLVLKWSRVGWYEMNEVCYNDEYVLEGLRPHVNLKSLEIEKFKGMRLPSWMTSESCSVLQNLVKIRLGWCGRCEHVPTLGNLPHLKKLELNGLNKVRKIGLELYHDSAIQNGEAVVFFPALKELSIMDMEMLEEWVDANQDASVSLFPSLEKLTIISCPCLSEFPNILRDCVELEELHVISCDSLEALPDMHGLKSLQDVTIARCNGLICLPRGLETITSLQSLTVRHCGRVAFVPNLERLTKLEYLYLADISKEVDELPALPSSLQSLILIEWLKLRELPQQLEKLSNLKNLHLLGCEGLEFLPEWLGNLLSLHRIFLYDCRNLKGLPSHEAMSRLTRLQHLTIFRCPLLTETCARESGSEWHKIQHIPYIQIDDHPIQELTSF